MTKCTCLQRGFEKCDKSCEWSIKGPIVRHDNYCWYVPCICGAIPTLKIPVSHICKPTLYKAKDWEEEFDRKTVTDDEDSAWVEGHLLRSGDENTDEPKMYQESMYELDPDKVKEFIKKLLAITEAETRAKCAEAVQKNFNEANGACYDHMNKLKQQIIKPPTE